MTESNPWKTIGSRLVYQNPWLRLREDKVIRPDGKEGIYSVLELPPSVGIVALNERNEVLLVGQWRYTHGKFSWEIPTGGSAGPSENILDAAKRELQEEAGVAASDWISLGTIDNSNGATTDVAHLFLASQISYIERHEEPTEQILLRWVLFQEAVSMVMDGSLTESCTVASLLKAQMLRQQ